MLVRKHVNKLLSSYYKQPHNAVVGSINPHDIETNPIDFGSVLGNWHWRFIYRNLYQKQTGQWLTPVELFRPFYSQIIGNFIATEAEKMKQMGNNEALQIVEIGGGRGTNALSILDHLQSNHPKVYEALESYTIIDSSPTLLDLVRNVLIEGPQENSNEQNTSSNRHFDKVVLKEVDMMDVSEKSASLLKKSHRPTIVLAMEVLDNLPHDKITMCENTGDILQAEIHPNCKNSKVSELKEVFTPLSDDLLQYVLPMQPSYLPTTTSNHGGAKWIPTVACGLLREIFKVCPNSSVILADFDWLPPPVLESGSVRTRRSLEGINEPLVTSMDDIDHICYLNAPPLCDILFPTNFPALSGYTEKLLLDSNIEATVKVTKQNDFLYKYGPDEIDRTRGRLTGFTPLLEDFTNCSVLTVSR